MTRPLRSSLLRRAFLFFLTTAPVASSLLAPASVRGSDVFQSTTGADSNSLFEKAKPAVVKVESGDSDLLLAGTGFFVDNQGTVLTSSTVIGDNTSARVTVNGLTLDAKILGNDPRSGLAMLKVVYDDSPCLNLGHSTDLKTGYAVITIGYPLNLPVASSQGLIGGFDIRYLNRFFATTHIHADVPLSPGQVGGPLLNTHGEVVGLVVPSPDDGRSIYALPVEAMEKIMTDFTDYGRAKHGWVGVNVVEVPDTQHDGRTVRVVQAVPGTPASHSGLLPGDTVLRIDAREIYRPADVLDASFFSHVGGNMNVVVRRDQAIYSYDFAVIERPSHIAPVAPVSTNPNGTSPQPILVNRVVPNPAQ
jgi:S1-C subfamily serine protease